MTLNELNYENYYFIFQFTSKVAPCTSKIAPIMSQNAPIVSFAAAIVSQVAPVTSKVPPEHALSTELPQLAPKHFSTFINVN